MHTQIPKLANEINKILTEKGYSSNNPLAVDGKVQIHILYSCDKYDYQDSFVVVNVFPDQGSIHATIISKDSIVNSNGVEKKVEFRGDETLFDLICDEEDYDGPNWRFVENEYWKLKDLYELIKNTL